MTRPAVFLDRDGTIIVDRMHLTDPHAVELLPGAAEAVRRLNEAGIFTVVVTNQAVVARGMASKAMVEAANARMQDVLRAEGAHIDAIYYCPDHPDFSIICECRKPAPGMLLRAAEEHDLDLERSFMVGDWWADIGAGVAAGTRTVLISGTIEKEAKADDKLAEHGLVPDKRVASLNEAVTWILGTIDRTP
jgi:D-glycero-D-manno-heptose 1,7-bisphosphate phosphatase